MKLKTIFWGMALLSTFAAFSLNASENPEGKKPNIILMLADDLGYGDTGFNGNKIIKTPNLDALANDGSILKHFYSVGPVCSPTRAAYLTGRHYYRLGVFYANQGHLPAQEYTIARMLKENGYTTGHFGKWHLGTLSKEHSSKGAGRKPELNFSPPWERDYDESFVTESAVQTWDPTKNKNRYKLNEYYHNGVMETENLEGCDSRIIMDRVIPFIEKAVSSNTPFLSVIWFHAPHAPVEAGAKYLAMYPDAGQAAHFYGCITALDDQVGRLRAKLKELGQEENTFIFFCSDNGPEGKHFTDATKTRSAGTTAGLTGRKRSVNEGGVRVPSFVYYPKDIKAGQVCDITMSTLDLLPTVAKITGAKINSTHILDGQDFMPIVGGQELEHKKSIPFRHDDKSTSYACLVKGDYKLIISSEKDSTKDKLYNLKEDITESSNIVKNHPEMAKEMRAEILAFLESAEKSHAGEEYASEYTPTNQWNELKGNTDTATKAAKAKNKKKEE